jgi:phthalate 4,5-dioxygenase
VHIRSSLVRCHWLQAVESVLDAAHIGFLHRDTVMRAMSATARNNSTLWLQQPVPKLEFETTRYGFREAALRAQADGTVNTKIREVVQPWHVLLPGEPGFERQIVSTVPIDGSQCLQFVIQLNPYSPLTQTDIDHFWADAGADPDDFGKELPGADVLWGQDREAMQNGHFSGLRDRHVFCEDFAILESMGPLADRSREHLTQSDGSVILNRQLLVRAARQLAAGETPPCLDERVGTDVGHLRTTSLNLPDGTPWQTWDVFAI